ncbi:hypothetical protein Acr_13g0004350 [Actinidia rufa]|uniref:Uncharacterized protein n=1 Tax=Actinidia rufa TaxID=165716 RepID=A0A7J0FK09_9ERIC|nr:hypothetical protein Acr_13g0004350 [Actinidia rufa]
MMMGSVCAEQQHKFHASHQFLLNKKSLMREIDIPPRKLLSRRVAAAEAEGFSPREESILLQKFLPYNSGGGSEEEDDDDADPYSSDHFRIRFAAVRGGSGEEVPKFFEPLLPILPLRLRISHVYPDGIPRFTPDVASVAVTTDLPGQTPFDELVLAASVPLRRSVRIRGFELQGCGDYRANEFSGRLHCGGGGGGGGGDEEKYHVYMGFNG